MHTQKINTRDRAKQINTRKGFTMLTGIPKQHIYTITPYPRTDTDTVLSWKCTGAYITNTHEYSEKDISASYLYINTMPTQQSTHIR